MDKNLPEFYITADESYSLKEVRECYPIKRFRAARRDDYLLIRINPLLDGQEYGINNNKISELIIATRHKGISLFPIVKWPVSVYVLHVLVPSPEKHDVLRDNEMTLIAWAEIFPSQELIR
jgi:hypothetical protein